MGPLLDRAVLSEEHNRLLVLIEDLTDCIAASKPDAERIAGVRWQMTRVLLAHLAKEDALLYPKLQAGPDARVAAMAERFASEMGDLATAYRGYIKDWPPTRMASEWPGFCAETRRIVQMLARRIECEETRLYPLIAFGNAQRSAA